MNPNLRSFRPDDEAALRAVFYSSVHDLASKYYTAEQLEAWAAREYDAARWAERMRAKQPFIAALDGQIAGHADLQASGFINHFSSLARMRIAVWPGR